MDRWHGPQEYFREVDAGPEILQERIRREASYWQWKLLRMYTKPTITMVNGWSYGGGFRPLAACDPAVCADDAFGLSKINWGNRIPRLAARSTLT